MIFFYFFIGNSGCLPDWENHDYDYDDIDEIFNSKIPVNNTSRFKKFNFNPNFIFIIVGIHVIIIIPIIIKITTSNRKRHNIIPV